MSCLSNIFDDKRLTCALLMTWLVIVMGVFSHLGVMQTQFMSFGPSPETFFMGLCLDSWYRWTWVAIFTFLSTAINDFVGDAVVPWIQNTIQDHKSHYIPYSKFTCWGITQCWSMYCSAMSVFSIYLLMSQIDFLIIRAFADSVVNLYTTYRFLRCKKTDPVKYARWYDQGATPASDAGSVGGLEVAVVAASEVFGEPGAPPPRDEPDADFPVATPLDVRQSEEASLVGGAHK